MEVPAAWRLLAVAAAVGLGAWLGIALTREAGRVASVWPPNGVLLAVLLAASGRRWPAYLAAGWVGNVAADLASGDTPAVAAALSLCNSAEVALAAAGLRRFAGPGAPDLTRPRDLARFAAVAGVAAPAVSALLGAAALHALAGAPFWQVARVWYPADALGLAIVAPLGLALRGAGTRDALAARRRPGEAAVVFGLLAASAAAVFAQSGNPLLFLLFPPLLVAVWRFGFAGATAGVALLAAVAVGFTVEGFGPLALIAGSSVGERVLLLQIFLLVASSTALQAAALLAERDRLGRALRDSETHFRLLAEHASDVFSRIGPDGARRYVSPAAERILGFAPEALAGRAPPEIVHPDDRRLVEEAMARLSAGSFEEAATYRIRHGGSGAEVWIEATARALSDPATGAPDGYIAVSRDVTARRRLEQEREARGRDLEAANGRLDRLARHLAKARDQAERASRAKSRFLAATSHELRTPLHGILGQAQLLRLEGRLDAGQAARVEAMLGAGRHLLEMIEHVLDLSQIEAERLELRPAEVDVRGLAAACLDLVRPMAEAKGLALRLEAGADAPRRLLADPARLRQVLLNLLGNAAKFTERGAVALRVLPGSGRGARFEVADTGPGVPADRKAMLFGEFERLGVGTGVGPAPAEGAGLGLAISARLAALMGGRVGHADNPGGGSVFWLELPLDGAGGPEAEPAAVKGVEAPGQAAAPRSEVQEAAPGRSLRVLVVDDMAMNRDVARGFLRAAGHEAVCAGGGREAVEAAAGGGFDAVLMDVRMPGMDGLEATRRIRALGGAPGRVPVLALTANALEEQVRECRSAGMDGHVSKPFTQAALLDAVSRAAARPAGAGAGAGAGATTGGAGRAAARVDAGPSVLDQDTFERTAGFLSAEEVAAHLATLSGRFSDLLRRLRAPDALAAGAAASAGLAEAAHSLAGAAGTFGFRRLSAAARAFEQAVEAGSPAAGARADELAAAAEASLEELRRRAPRPPHPACADTGS